MSVRILQGDCREVLRTLPDESVHCVVTSPPYWGLRDYGVDGQIGSEESFWDFLDDMVAVFREVRRVLRSDGVAWVNMGDAYANDGKWGGATAGKHAKSLHGGETRIGREKRRTGLKPKDLIGQPWRLAFALQDDGWWLRRDIIWHKLNPMPEFVGDRCTTAHEYLFQLTKSAHYFYDALAIQEPVTGGAHARKPGPNSRAFVDRVPRTKKASGVTPKSAEHGIGIKANSSFHAAGGDLVDARNKRSVWSIASEPFQEAHFATFPTRLIEPCILAGCPAGGTVLDPFGGAGTTGLVAQRLERDALLIELNPEYAAMAERRIAADRAGPVERDRIRHGHRPADHGPLFADPALIAAE